MFCVGNNLYASIGGLGSCFGTKPADKSRGRFCRDESGLEQPVVQVSRQRVRSQTFIYVG